MALVGGADASSIYRTVRLDASGRALSNPGADGAADQYYSAFVDNHADTVRWTYTCPAGVLAILELLYGSVSLLASENTAYVRITTTRDGGSGLQVLSVTGRAAFGVDTSIPCIIVLRAGDSRAAYSYNNDGTSRVLSVGAAIREITL